MRFFHDKEFAEYIYKTFSLEEGTIIMYRAETVDLGADMFVFWYGPSSAENSDEPHSKLKTGWHVAYSTDSAESEEKLVGAVTEWYGIEPLEVVGFQKEEDDLYGVLVTVHAPTEYWENEQPGNI